MSITGIVLAGGLSTRMGRDKALLPWQGRTLLEHMRGLLMQAGAREVWVSGLPGVRRHTGPPGTLRAAGRALQRGDAHARWPGLGGAGGYTAAAAAIATAIA